ncbi:MAG: hypothetical protein HDR21_12250 [Lachnospiraceae bacterium]|nr:hypothetical protein [Lachnospiraceae bacterium]
MKKKKNNKLNLGGGVVNTTRITSKGILFAGKKHYNSEHIQRYCGREVLVHEVGGCMKAYLYEDGGKTLGRLLCVIETHEKAQEKPEYYTEEYYQQLIEGKLRPRCGFDMFIQKKTKKDAGLVLACIGLDHPASREVLRYLADQKEQLYPKPNPFRNFIRRNSHFDPVKDQEKHPKEGGCVPYNIF